MPSPDLPTCWKIAEAKSGSAFALACYVGTRVSTHQSDRLHHLETFGRHLGTIIQISDDVLDLEADTKRHEKNHLWSPLANAYLLQIGLNTGEIAGKYLANTSESSSIQRSLLLYLRLEALKYAEMARSELKTVQLAAGPREQILRMLNHLSSLGANLN